MSAPGHYLNRRRSQVADQGLLETLVEHYDALDRLLALVEPDGVVERVMRKPDLN